MSVRRLFLLLLVGAPALERKPSSLPLVALNEHKRAKRGTPGSVCPQPEPNATELPSCAPISVRTAQRQGGGGGGVARRARAARARKPKSYATSCATSSTTPCAASFTCSSFMCHLRAGVWGGEGSRRPAPQHTFFSLKGCVRRVSYVLALHVSTATVTGPAAPSSRR